MAEDKKNPLNEVTREAARRLADQIKYIRQYQTIPMGKERMTPEQVKQKYGISVSEIRRLQAIHGEEAMNEVLKALEGMGGLK